MSGRFGRERRSGSIHEIPALTGPRRFSPTNVDKTGTKIYNKRMTDKHKFKKAGKNIKEGHQEPGEIYFSHNNLFTIFFEEKQVVESFLKTEVI